MSVRLLGYQDVIIKLEFNRDDINDDIETANIEILDEDISLSDIEKSLQKWKSVQSKLNILCQDEN